MQSPMTRHGLLTRLMDDINDELTALWQRRLIDDSTFYRLSMAVVWEFIEDPDDYAMDALFHRITKETTNADC